MGLNLTLWSQSIHALVDVATPTHALLQCNINCAGNRHAANLARKTRPTKTHHVTASLPPHCWLRVGSQSNARPANSCSSEHWERAQNTTFQNTAPTSSGPRVAPGWLQLGSPCVSRCPYSKAHVGEPGSNVCPSLLLSSSYAVWTPPRALPHHTRCAGTTHACPHTPDTKRDQNAARSRCAHKLPMHTYATDARLQSISPAQMG